MENMAVNVALEVFLNKKHHFMVVFARDRTVCDLGCEIKRCASDVFPELGEIEVTVITTESGAVIPGRYKVGEVLQNGSKIFSFSSDYKRQKKRKRKKKDYEKISAKQPKLSNKPQTKQSERNLKQRRKHSVNGSKNRRHLLKKRVSNSMWKKAKDLLKPQKDFTDNQVNRDVREPDVTEVNGNNFMEHVLADTEELQTEGMAESVSCIRGNITSPRQGLKASCDDLHQKLPLSRNLNRKKGMTHDNPEVNSSEAVLRASNYKHLFDLDEYCHPRKRKAVEKSASKVAMWLWSSDALSSENEENHSGCETWSVEKCGRSTSKVVENAEQTAELNRCLERDGEMTLDAGVTDEQRPQRPSSREHVHTECSHVRATETMNSASAHTPERREPCAASSETCTITGDKSPQAKERELQTVDKNDEKLNTMLGNGKDTCIPSPEAGIEVDASVRRRIRTCQIRLQKLPLDIGAIMTKCLQDNSRLHVSNTRSRENETTLQEICSSTRETSVNNVATGEQSSVIEGAKKVGTLSSKTCGLEEGRISNAAVKSSAVEGEENLDKGRSPSVFSDREKRNTSRYIVRSLSEDERPGNHEFVPAIKSTHESAEGAAGNPISSNNAPDCLTTVRRDLKNIECTTNGNSHSPVKSRDSVSRDLPEKSFVEEKNDKDQHTQVHQLEVGNSGSDCESETGDESQGMEDNTKAPIGEVMRFELYKKGKQVVFWKEAEDFPDGTRNSLRNSSTNHEIQGGKLAEDRKSIPSPRDSVPMKEEPPSSTEVNPVESSSGEAVQGIGNEETSRFTKNDGSVGLESADETELYRVDEKSEGSIKDKITPAKSKLNTERDVQVSGEGEEKSDLHETIKVLITEAEEKSADSVTYKENENTLKENQRVDMEGQEKGNSNVYGKNETEQKVHGDFEGDEEKQDEIVEDVKGKEDKEEVNEYEGVEESQGGMLDEAKKVLDRQYGGDFFEPGNQLGNQNPVHEDEENDFLAGNKLKDNLEDDDHAEITKTKQSSLSDSEYEKNSKRKRKRRTENLREKGTRIEFEESKEESERNEVQNLEKKGKQKKLKRRSSLQSEESVPERSATEIMSPPSENEKEVEFERVKEKDRSEHNEVQNLAKKEGRKKRRSRVRIHSEDSTSERSSTEIMSPPNLHCVESISSERTVDDSEYSELSPQLPTEETELVSRKADTLEERLNQEGLRKKNEKAKEMSDDSGGEDTNLVLNKKDELVEQISKEASCEGQESVVGKIIEVREKGRKRTVTKEESRESDHQGEPFSDHSMRSKKTVKRKKIKVKGSARTQLMSPESGEEVDLSQESSLSMAFEETEKVKEKIGRRLEDSEGDLAIEKNEVSQQEGDTGEQENATQEFTVSSKRSRKAKKTKMAVVEEARMEESDMMATSAPRVCRDVEFQDSMGNENSLGCDSNENVFSGNDVTDENMECKFPISVNKPKPQKRKKERMQTLEEGDSVLTNSKTETRALSPENAGSEKTTISDSVVSTDFEKSKKRKKRITENLGVKNTLISDKMQVEDSVIGESRELSNRDVVVPKEILKETKTMKEIVEYARKENSDLVLDKTQLESSVSGEKEELFDQALKKAGKIKKKRKHEGVVPESIHVQVESVDHEDLSQELEVSVGKKKPKTKRNADEKKRRNDEGNLVIDSAELFGQGNGGEDEYVRQVLETSVGMRKTKGKSYLKGKRNDGNLVSDSTQEDCQGNTEGKEELTQELENSGGEKKSKSKRNTGKKKQRKDEDLSQELVASEGTKKSNTKQNTDRNSSAKDEGNGLTVDESLPASVNTNGEQERRTQDALLGKGTKARKRCSKGKRKDSDLLTGTRETQNDVKDEQASQPKEKASAKIKGKVCLSLLDLVEDAEQESSHGDKTTTPRASSRKSSQTLLSRFLQTPQGFLDTTKQRQISTSTTGLYVKHKPRTTNTKSLNLKPLTRLEQELVSSRVNLKQLLGDDSIWDK